jgi:hypothetical protein
MTSVNDDWAGLATARAVWDFTTGHRAGQCHRLRYRGAQRVRERGCIAEPRVRLHAHPLIRIYDLAGGGPPPMLRRP